MSNSASRASRCSNGMALAGHFGDGTLGADELASGLTRFGITSVFFVGELLGRGGLNQREPDVLALGGRVIERLVDLVEQALGREVDLLLACLMGGHLCRLARRPAGRRSARRRAQRA